MYSNYLFTMPVSRYRRPRRTYPVRRTKRKRTTPFRRTYKRTIKPRSRLLYCPTAIPDKMRVKLSFANTIAVSTVGGAQAQVYRVIANYQPFSTTPFSSSMNPQAWDQWGNMYYRYRPLAMKVTANFGITNETTGIQCIFMRGYWSDLGAGLSSDIQVLQNRYTKNKRLNADTPFQTIKSYSNLSNVTGQTRMQWLTDQDTQAGVTASPIKQVSYWIHLVSTSGTIAMNGHLEIVGDLWVEFFNPRIMVDA